MRLELTRITTAQDKESGVGVETRRRHRAVTERARAQAAATAEEAERVTPMYAHIAERLRRGNLKLEQGAEARFVLSHAGPRTTASARWTPILEDFISRRRISPPRVPRSQSPHTIPFNSN
jgi:hypothetical protein